MRDLWTNEWLGEGPDPEKAPPWVDYAVALYRHARYNGSDMHTFELGEGQRPSFYKLLQHGRLLAGDTLTDRLFGIPIRWTPNEERVVLLCDGAASCGCEIDVGPHLHHGSHVLIRTADVRGRVTIGVDGVNSA